MSRMVGGFLGSLLMLIPAGLILATSQAQNCDRYWYTCSPGSDAAFTAQMIGGALLITGPYLGYRIGARLAPQLVCQTAVGVVVGAIPGIVTVPWGWWAPYAATLMVVGAIIGGVIATLMARSRPRNRAGGY